MKEKFKESLNNILTKLKANKYISRYKFSILMR